MAPPPNCSLCFSLTITRVIAQKKQGEQLGGGAIADGETRAKNGSGDGPLTVMYKQDFQSCSRPGKGGNVFAALLFIRLSTCRLALGRAAKVSFLQSLRSSLYFPDTQLHDQRSQYVKKLSESHCCL
jgi:hypothetical protein